jgi:hypothetical protein
MKKLLLILALFISVSSFSQKKILVADETWAIESTTGNLRIISSSDTVVKNIIKMFSGQFTSFSSKIKKDRKGDYWEYSFSFPSKNREGVVKYLNSI